MEAAHQQVLDDAQLDDVFRAYRKKNAVDVDVEIPSFRAALQFDHVTRSVRMLTRWNNSQAGGYYMMQPSIAFCPSVCPTIGREVHMPRL